MSLDGFVADPDDGVDQVFKWYSAGDLAPVVLGRGIRLFDHLTRPVELVVTEVTGNPNVTHITYQVIK